MTEDAYIRLRGGKAERFFELKDALEDERGYPMTHVEAMCELMNQADVEPEGRPRAPAEG